MSAHEQPDPILQVLADLAPMTPSAGRDRRVLARCHASLARQQSLRRAAERSRTVGARLIDAAMAAAIGVYGATAALEGVRLVLAQ